MRRKRRLHEASRSAVCRGSHTHAQDWLTAPLLYSRPAVGEAMTLVIMPASHTRLMFNTAYRCVSAQFNNRSFTVLFSRAHSTLTSRMVKAKKYVVEKHFEGEPKRSDLKIVEEELPALKNGEFLIQAEYLSVDPYMRPYILRYPTGITMIGSQVAIIIESKNPEYPVGKRVVAYAGWRSHTIINLDDAKKQSGLQQMPYIVPDFGDLPVSLALGVLGMPGNTAYFGLLEICKPKKGDTLVVSGAAGAVGSHVGQIGKSLGLKVIGIAGSDVKCNWLKKDLGFDHAINYKTEDVGAALTKAAPNGVDCYFDNVGGDISSAVIYKMNPWGRVSVCGSISSYNEDPKKLPKCPLLQPAIVFGQLKIEGFIVARWMDRWFEGIEESIKMIRDGKLKHRETVTEGFDNMFDAFTGMLRGDNVGKAIVKA